MSIALEAINEADGALALAEDAYAEAKKDFKIVEEAYLKLISADPKSSILALIKKYAPKLAVFAGLPGGAAILSQPGFLDKVTGLVGGLFGG